MGNSLPFDIRGRCSECDNPACVAYTVSGTRQDMDDVFPNGYSTICAYGTNRQLKTSKLPEATIFRCSRHPFTGLRSRLTVKRESW